MKKWSAYDLPSYISITDFAKPEEVRMMADFFEEHSEGRRDCRLGVGVMMSRKSLNKLETKWAKVWPKLEEYPALFQSNWLRSIHQHVLYNVLHYADYDGIDVCKNLIKAVEVAGGVYVNDNPWNDGTQHLHAVQLDMIWPDPKELGRFHEATGSKLEIILQINSNALDMIDNDPKKLVKKLSEYQFALRRVLLDKSMGRGLGMDAKALLPFARAIKEDSFTHRLGIGVAGGLGPTSLHLLDPFLAEMPDISWDAQSKLHPDGNTMIPIDWNLGKEYVKESLKRMPRRDLAKD
jgi:hypothetical protein